MGQAIINGGILCGGSSRRMGRPKQLLQVEGCSLFRRQFDELAPFVDQVALLGKGPLPHDLPPLPVLPDPPGIHGPLAGLLAAFRWNPRVSWLICACDMPNIKAPAIKWLLSQAVTGAQAVMPALPGNDWCEPLFAWYGPAMIKPLEALAAEGNLRPSLLATGEGVLQPTVPTSLTSAWKNLNRPEDLPGSADFLP